MRAGVIRRCGAAYIATLTAMAGGASRHAGIVVLAASILTMAGGWYVAGHFEIDTDAHALLSRGLPFIQRQQAFDRAFPQLQDTIVAVVDGQTPGQAREAARRLSRWLRHQHADFQYVYQPGGGRFFATHGLLYLDNQQLTALGDRLATAQPLIATLAANPTLPGFFDLLSQALDDNGDGARSAQLATTLQQVSATVEAFNRGRFKALDWQRIVTPTDNGPMNGRRRFVIVKPRFDYTQIQPAAVPIAHLRQAISNLRLNSDRGVRVRLTGSAMLDNEQLGSIADGAGWTTALALGLVVVLLIVALRSPPMVIATLATLLMGLVWTTAFGLLAVGRFNILSVSFAVLFVGLSVDFGIQFCMRSREIAAYGAAPDAIALRTAYSIGGALTLAGWAAAASFFSFVPTYYAGLADLGLIAGVSMIIAVIANLSVLPALITLFKTYPRGGGRPHNRGGVATLALPRWNRGLIGMATLVGIAALPLALSVRFDFNPLNLQNPHSEAVRTLNQLIHSGDFSPYSLDVLAPGIAAADALAKRLEKRPTVARAMTIDDYVPDHQARKLATIANLSLIMPPSSLVVATPAKTTHGASVHAVRQLLTRLRQAPPSPARRRLSSALAVFLARSADRPAALHHLQNLLLTSLPRQLENLRLALKADRVTRDHLPARLKARYVTKTGQARIQVFSALNLSSNPNLERFVDDVRHIAPDAVGTPILLVEGGNAVTQAFVQASVTAFILIALLLWLVLGRWRDVLLALSPLPWAGLLTAANMRLLGLSFNLANIIVFPLLIGLGVAYSIYFVMRWRTGENVHQVLRSTTPAAVLFSALTTTFSFGSLALSDSSGIAILGQTLSLALAWVLLATLTVLPALLSLCSPAGNTPRYRSARTD